MALDAGKLRGQSPDELDKEEAELRGAIWKLQLQRAAGQAQDPHRMRGVRRDLARVLTVKRELERGDAAGRR